MDITISETMDTFVSSKWKSPATQKNYKTGLAQFALFMQTRLDRPALMSDLYAAILVDFDEWLGKGGKKDGSRSTYIASVVAWLNNALLRETLPDTFKLDRAKALWRDGQKRSSYHARPPQEFMDFPKVVASLNTVPEQKIETKGKTKYLAALRDRAFVWFLYATGARQGCTRNLMIKQVVDENGQIRSRINAKGKGDKDGVLLLQEPGAIQAIKEYLDARDDHSEFLFISHDRNRGEPICGTTGWRIIHEAAKELGLDYSPHDARHFGAIHRVNNGTKMEVVSKWLWHSSIATTSMIYAHIQDDTLEKAVRDVKMPSVTGLMQAGMGE